MSLFVCLQLYTQTIGRIQGGGSSSEKKLTSKKSNRNRTESGETETRTCHHVGSESMYLHWFLHGLHVSSAGPRPEEPDPDPERLF